MEKFWITRIKCGEIEGKKIHEYRFQVKKNDCFVLMSDGVIYAGAGSILNMQG